MHCCHPNRGRVNTKCFPNICQRSKRASVYKVYLGISLKEITNWSNFIGRHQRAWKKNLSWKKNKMKKKLCIDNMDSYPIPFLKWFDPFLAAQSAVIAPIQPFQRVILFERTSESLFLESYQLWSYMQTFEWGEVHMYAMIYETHLQLNTLSHSHFNTDVNTLDILFLYATR